ncbi:hypothetical protein [uncultured Methylophaga sp.]|jgi:hypothetical protein|uniref:hypothetical protein n=1 Tax=uncultured Methylophaga sp. TaxID=285271 RepID=UPI0030D6D7DD
MNSEHRKHKIKSMLKRGDLKLLADKLDMSYSYLSQAFSPASKFNFTEELARKVEQSMGWQVGILDALGTSTLKPKAGGLHLLALRGRAAKLSSFFPKLRVELNQSVKLAGIEKNIDIVVYNHDSSILLVAEQSQDYENSQNLEQLILIMAISGAQYGVVFSADSGFGEMADDNVFDVEEKRSKWFQFKNGKVTETAYGPKRIFEGVGV